MLSQTPRSLLIKVSSSYKSDYATFFWYERHQNPNLFKIKPFYHSVALLRKMSKLVIWSKSNF